MESLYYGRQCDHKALKRKISDLNQVLRSDHCANSQLSSLIFLVKSYEMMREFWDQFAQILQKKNSVIDYGFDYPQT